MRTSSSGPARRDACREGRRAGDRRRSASCRETVDRQVLAKPPARCLTTPDGGGGGAVRARRRRRRATGVALVAAALLSVVAACGTDTGAGDDPRTVTVWNLDGQPDRLAAVKKINERFTQRTGVRVDEVSVQENQLPSLVASAAVSGTLPDLISGLPLAYLRQLEGQRLLDTRTAATVVRDLEPATYA